MLTTALLDVRVLPWKAKPRVLNKSVFRDEVFSAGPPIDVDDLGGLVIGIALWIGLLIAAPVIVIVLAVLLFSVELPLVLGLAVVLLVVRFTGIVPWTVLIINQVNGEETRETFRFMPSALRRIREINHDRRVKVRWHWV